VNDPEITEKGSMPMCSDSSARWTALQEATASERRKIQRATGPWTASTVRSSACSHPTLDVVVAELLVEVVTLHLDRGYDSGAVCEQLAGYQLTEFKVERRGTKMPGVKKQPVRLGMRWVVEATNTWSSDYASSAAALTARALTGTPRSAWRPQSPSSAAPSPTETAGVDRLPEHLSAQS
jgi:hypothetical protein